MLSLDKRAAQVGSHINSRGEIHGEETVTALDIPLSGIMLNDREVNALTQDPYTFAAMYNARNGDKLPEPNFEKWCKPCYALKEKIEAANVTIVHGVSSETIRLINVKIAKIKLYPTVGGMTELTCTIQCTPDLNEAVSKLLGRLNSSVEVSIDGGQFGKQQDLPLNSVGAGEHSTPSVGAGESMDADAPVQESFSDEAEIPQEWRDKAAAQQAQAAADADSDAEDDQDAA